MSLSAIVADGVGGGRDIRSAQPSRCVCSRCKSLGKKNLPLRKMKGIALSECEIYILCVNTLIRSLKIIIFVKILCTKKMQSV